MPWAVGDQALVPLQSGKVLMVGGWDSEYSETRTALFDPATNKWTQTGSLKTDRYSHTATLLKDGRVLVTGGTKGSWYTPPGPQVLASAELFDESTGQWTAAAPMSTPRTGATATLLQDGRVLVAGGTTDATTEIYDPVADRWAPADGLSSARSGHSATLLPDGTAHGRRRRQRRPALSTVSRPICRPRTSGTTTGASDRRARGTSPRQSARRPCW